MASEDSSPLPREERLGVLLVGACGSVATTTIAGVRAHVRGLHPARGLLTETALAGDDLAPLEGLRFAGWDLAEGSAYDAAVRAEVLPRELLQAVQHDLEAVPVLDAPRAGVTPVILESAEAAERSHETLREAADRLVREVDVLKGLLDVDRAVVVNLASTEASPRDPPATVAELEAAIDADAPGVTPGMLYAYAAFRAGCGHVNFTPSTAAEAPALNELAHERGLPYAGKDGKTGQTLYKSALAAMFRLRDLRIRGWYSANILGNRDGAVLADPAHADPKVRSKARALSSILGYNDFEHSVRIDNYGPRGDRKEAWDVIDFEGWLGTRMSMRVNWQGADSPLAAPLVVDLVRLTDLAQRRGDAGALGELGLFFKDPHACDEHDPFRQLDRLVEWRWREATRPVPVEPSAQPKGEGPPDLRH